MLGNWGKAIGAPIATHSYMSIRAYSSLPRIARVGGCMSRLTRTAPRVSAVIAIASIPGALDAQFLRTSIASVAQQPAAGRRVPSEVICTLGKKCPAGTLIDAVLTSDGSAMIAYASGLIFRTRAHMSPLEAVAIEGQRVPARLAETSPELLRHMAVAKSATSVLTPGSELLELQNGTAKVIAARIPWPPFSVQGSLAGAFVAALVVPPARRSNDLVVGTVVVWSIVERDWKMVATFPTRARAVVGSRFASNPGPFRSDEKWAIDPAGNVWIGHPWHPSVVRYDAATLRPKTIRWVAPTRRISKREIDSVRSRLYAHERIGEGPMQAAMRRQTDAFMANLAPEKPAIAAIVASADGTVWVKKTPGPLDKLTEWLALTSEGRIQRTVALPSNVRLFDSRGRYLLLGVMDGEDKTRLLTIEGADRTP